MKLFQALTCIYSLRKVLRELHNDYPFGPDEIEIERKIRSEYQLNITDLHNVPTGNVKRLYPDLFIFFDKEKYVLHYENLPFF